MNKYKIDNTQIDSVELKCLIISRGVKVDNAVYKHYKNTARLNINPLCCNCLLLSDNTIVQLTDTNFHLRYLSGILSWDNLKLLKYIGDLGTPFTLRMQDKQAVLFYNNTPLDTVTFPPASDFYKQKTTSKRPYVGNTVLQGFDWVAFQCLWPCEIAAAGHPCQFCFSGGDFENAARKGKALPQALPVADVSEVVEYALKNEGVSHVQITGGSTLDGKTEAIHIAQYLEAMQGAMPPGEVILYVTPPADTGVLDNYFALGTSRVACSIEVWDLDNAKDITPGKVNVTGRDRHLSVLEFIAEKYGNGKALSNLIVGIEDFATLAQGATWLAQRGILPAPSVWMPMGRPVLGSMKAPEVDFYKRVKELFAELYTKYELEPTNSKGVHVFAGRDIWNYAKG